MRRVLFAVAVAALVGSGPAHAQVGIGPAGGPSFPTGSLSDIVDAGFHGGIALDIGVPLLPFGLRADLVFQQLPGTAGSDDFRQISGTLAARIGVVPLPILSPYLMAGAGLYGSSWDPDPAVDGDWTADPGVNVGVGVRVNLLVVRPFVEARYHRVASDPGRGFIPVTVGITF